MTPENIEQFKALLKNYLEVNNLHIYKEIYQSYYHINVNKNDKDKQKTNDYVIDRFIKEYTLSTDENSENYKFWKFVCKKNLNLGREIVSQYIDIPTKDYLRDEYVTKVIQLYTNNKNDNHILWSIVQQRKFLNNNIKVVEQLFNEHALGDFQKEHVVKYYVALLDKNVKFNTLENKRIISLLNESLTQPLSIDLLESEQTNGLNIKTTTSSCVYFEADIKNLMAYNLKLSHNFAEHLLDNFHVLLPKVPEAETKDVITRKIKINEKTQSYHYAILTNLHEKVINKTFTHFVDSYLQTIDNSSFLSKDEMLDCLKFSVIKARKENLESRLVDKNIKTKVNKI